MIGAGKVGRHGESMISIARTTKRNVTRWRQGQMVLC
jgi:hypothetical protein